MFIVMFAFCINNNIEGSCKIISGISLESVIVRGILNFLELLKRVERIGHSPESLIPSKQVPAECWLSICQRRPFLKVLTARASLPPTSWKKLVIDRRRETKLITDGTRSRNDVTTVVQQHKSANEVTSSFHMTDDNQSRSTMRSVKLKWRTILALLYFTYRIVNITSNKTLDWWRAKWHFTINYATTSQTEWDKIFEGFLKRFSLISNTSF